MSKPNRKNFKGIALNAAGAQIGAIYAEAGAYVVYGWKDSGGFSGEKSAPIAADKFSFVCRFDNGFQVEKHYALAA
jgi:hypothetical protein